MDYSKAKTVIYHSPCGSYELFTGEARIANFFDNVGERWEKPGWYKVGREVKYRPDFYLPRLNLFIEVKNLNVEDLLDDPVGIEKMRMFYECGYSLYCVDGMPVTDAGFAYEKYQNSAHIFFSNKFIQAYSPFRENQHETFMLFNKKETDNKLWLMESTERTSIDYFNEAYKARGKSFTDDEQIVSLLDVFGPSDEKKTIKKGAF